MRTLFRLVVRLLLLAAVVFWARSFRHVDGLALFDHAGRLNGIASDRGTVLLFSSKFPFGRDQAWRAETFTTPTAEFRESFDGALYAPEALKFKFAGFKASTGKYTAVDATPGTPSQPAVVWPFALVTVPDWFIAAVLLVPAVRGVRRFWLRRLRRRRGRCPECGYDLRGSAGRCPECGAGAAAAAV